MKKTLLLGAIFALTLNTLAQESITLNSLWQRYEFYAGGISGLTKHERRRSLHHSRQRDHRTIQLRNREQVGIVIGRKGLRSEALKYQLSTPTL